MTEGLQFAPERELAAGGSGSDAPDQLGDARRLLHAAMAEGRIAEVDRLSTLCFALIRERR